MAWACGTACSVLLLCSFCTALPRVGHMATAQGLSPPATPAQQPGAGHRIDDYWRGDTPLAAPRMTGSAQVRKSKPLPGGGKRRMCPTVLVCRNPEGPLSRCRLRPCCRRSPMMNEQIHATPMSPMMNDYSRIARPTTSRSHRCSVRAAVR